MRILSWCAAIAAAVLAGTSYATTHGMVSDSTMQVGFPFTFYAACADCSLRSSTWNWGFLLFDFSLFWLLALACVHYLRQNRKSRLTQPGRISVRIARMRRLGSHLLR